MRVVLDTNVLVSGIFFAGPPSRILEAWLDDMFDLVVSTEILEEYRRTARRIGEKFPKIDLGPLLDRIAVHALLVDPARLPGDACADRNDVKFLECALAARAERVVSGDRALLRASGYGGIEVVTPGDSSSSSRCGEPRASASGKRSNRLSDRRWRPAQVSIWVSTPLGNHGLYP